MSKPGFGRPAHDPEKVAEAVGETRAPKRKANEAFPLQRGDHKRRKDSRALNAQSSLPLVSLPPKIVMFRDDMGRSAPTLTKCAVGSRSGLKARAADLVKVRQGLPIHNHAGEIRTALCADGDDVLLLVGETGSGKSTQVPQYLVNEKWCRSRTVKISRLAEPNESSKGPDASCRQVKVGGCIAITQPRRVAAISLARRVAEEMGTPLGNSSPSSRVGYSVRFDNSTSPATRIKFLTEGMLLQEMLRDPWLRDYSAVVVDEVHERGVNVDLVLGLLKQMNEGKREGRGGIAMKVVVMSATANMERINDFFTKADNLTNGHATVAVQKVKAGFLAGQLTNRQEMVDEHGVKSDTDSGKAQESDWSGISDAETSGPLVSSHSEGMDMAVNASIHPSSPAVCHIKGRQYPVQTIYTPQPVSDWVDAALQRIVDIHLHKPLPGDILVFLTGQETVESLESLCNDYAKSLRRDRSEGSVPKLLILPLFAALPQHAQQRVFDSTPKGTRKVILSTNIAETSLTVPGIRYVIDSGKAKRRQFRSRLNLDSLLVKSISKSSASQRRGRAGREAPGVCYRLYPELEYLKLAPDNDPEILRCDLGQVVLSLKARGVDDLISFPWLTAPQRPALEAALLHLLQLGALDHQTGHITPLGQDLALLPLPANLARVLLASDAPGSDCLDEAIDIISALSVESIFLPTHTATTAEARREAAETARAQFYRREGDHLTLLAVMQAYTEENSDRKRWCGEHFISHRAMRAAMDVRKQLAALMARRNQSQSGSNKKSLSPNLPGRTKPHTSDIPLPTRILQVFLTGFMSNTALLQPDGSYLTLHGQQKISIHPSSVLFGKKVEAFLYNEFVWTQRGYARGVSAIETGWLQ